MLGTFLQECMVPESLYVGNRMDDFTTDHQSGGHVIALPWHIACLVMRAGWVWMRAGSLDT